MHEFDSSTVHCLFGGLACAVALRFPLHTCPHLHVGLAILEESRDSYFPLGLPFPLLQSHYASSLPSSSKPPRWSSQNHRCHQESPRLCAGPMRPAAERFTAEKEKLFILV